MPNPSFFRTPTWSAIVWGLNAFFIITLIGLLIFLSSDMKKHNEKISDLRDKAETRSNTIDSLSLIQKEYEIVKPYMGAIEGLLPTQDRLINFPREINTIGRQNKIDATVAFRNSSLSSNQGGSLQSTEFDLSLQGPAEGFLPFLQSLNQGFYSIKFTSFDFNSQAQNNFRAIMKGQVFTR